jgi:hypothetical protein
VVSLPRRSEAGHRARSPSAHNPAFLKVPWNRAFRYLSRESYYDNLWPRFSFAFPRVVDSREQRFVSQGLRKNGGNASGFAAFPDSVIAVGGNDDGRNLNTVTGQIMMKLQAGHFRLPLAASIGARSPPLHTGDTYWNGIYPFIDYSTGGSIDG